MKLDLCIFKPAISPFESQPAGVSLHISFPPRDRINERRAQFLLPFLLGKKRGKGQNSSLSILQGPAQYWCLTTATCLSQFPGLISHSSRLAINNILAMTFLAVVFKLEVNFLLPEREF